MEYFIQIMIMLAAAAGCFLVGSGQLSFFILAGGMLGVFAVSVGFGYRRRKQIESLTDYLMKLQDGLNLPELKEHNEGSIGILQSEIYKLVVRLSQRSDIVAKEKKYLADMLSDISHQIKTPLAAITIMTDLLKNPQLSPEKRLEFIGNIDWQTERITWLIRNLLTLSQLEAGVLKLKREKILVEDLLERTVQPFEIMAEVKEIELSVQADPQIMLVCDIHWTVEALSNIIKNSLEHTPCGGRVSIMAAQNNFTTNIQISDNGEGIPKERLPHIFERFYKIDAHSKTSIGIGLSMSRQIVLLQNGIITAESEIGEGTKFLIKFYNDY